ncbi:MAG: lysylphosphatidylglycerol synthase transmembrane domain-containing protein [Planctomycetota bacterium]
MKRHLITLLKVVVSVGILAFLGYRASQDNAFGDLRDRFFDPGFNWWLLGAAWLACGIAVEFTIVRWWVLVRALRMPIGLAEAHRVGFLGYLFNLAPMGVVGGDVLKAVLLARHLSGRRTQALATVIVDRVIGLYMLFVVASAAVWFTGLLQHPNENVRYVAQGTLWTLLIFTTVLVVPFIPGVTDGPLARQLQRLPYIGAPLGHFIDAVHMYRRNLGVLALTVVMSVFVHTFFAIGIYLITLGIYGGDVAQLSLAGEFVVSPLSAATGVIPVSVGPMEAVLDLLYVGVFGMAKGQGFVVALGYRIVTLLIAMVGVGYYLTSREELTEAMHEAEEIEEQGEMPLEAVEGEPARA